VHVAKQFKTEMVDVTKKKAFLTKIVKVDNHKVKFLGNSGIYFFDLLMYNSIIAFVVRENRKHIYLGGINKNGKFIIKKHF